MKSSIRLFPSSLDDKNECYNLKQFWRERGRGREWQQHRNGRKGERRRMKKELGTWSKFFFISDIIIIQRLVFSSYLPSLLPISDITFWSTILQARNIDWMGCEFMHLLFHDYPKFFWIQFQVVLKKLSFGIKFLPLHFFISFLLFISVTFLSCIMLCLQWEKCPTMTSRIPRSGLIIHSFFSFLDHNSRSLLTFPFITRNVFLNIFILQLHIHFYS